MRNNHAYGIYNPILTYNFFTNNQEYLTTPTFSNLITLKDESQIEIDLILYYQEHRNSHGQRGLIIAECKSYNLFEKEDFDRMLNIETAIPPLS